jgi:hypothetical protein
MVKKGWSKKDRKGWHYDKILVHLKEFGLYSVYMDKFGAIHIIVLKQTIIFILSLSHYFTLSKCQTCFWTNEAFKHVKVVVTLVIFNVTWPLIKSK